MITIAVNGFGRIGRAFVRAFLQNKALHAQVRLAKINVAKATIADVAHLFMYDTLMGTYQGSAVVEGGNLVIDGYRIELVGTVNLSDGMWRGVDWVVDCSGHFTKRQEAQKHIAAGAQNVLISAPVHDEDITIIPGVNMEQFNPKKHHIVSLGSCTTNAFVPLVSLLHRHFGIESGCMTTVHAYTNSQVLLDVEAKDLRCARAAALNIIPTTTGASAMLVKMIPELASKIACTSVRVPVGKVSLIDLSLVLKKPVTVDDLHQIFFAAAQKEMRDILAVTDKPLVSSDFSGNSHSVVVDTLLTQVVGSAAQVFGWYDNEWAYSVRLVDFLAHVARAS